MAKAPPKADGVSRIKFIMLEAELPAGDIQQFTQAIQSALRPVGVSNQRAVTAITSVPRASGTADEQRDEEVEAEAEMLGDEIDVAEPAVLKRVTPGKPRKYPSPKVLSDVDLKKDPSWGDFVAARSADSILEKYLMAAAWFKECRGLDAISVDHVYTCFRLANWSTAIQDFSQPLRRLRADQLLESPSKGLFSINHVGLDKVEKLKNG